MFNLFFLAMFNNSTTATMEVMKTPFRAEREERDRALYEEYMMLTVQGQPVTMVQERLMRKYRIHSVSTIYNILKRVAAQVQNENKQKA